MFHKLFSFGPTFGFLLACLVPLASLVPLAIDEETQNLLAQYRRGHSDLFNLDDVGGKSGERKWPWSGLGYCPDKIEPTKHVGKETTDDSIPRISSCPWYWTLNYDPRRNPSLILTAECTCTQCINTTDGARCVPVHYFRDVTYKVQEGTSEEKDVHKLYRVAVGCTCERQTTKKKN